MKLISDVINELNELREMYGNIECVDTNNESPSFEYQNEEGQDPEECIVFG